MPDASQGDVDLVVRTCRGECNAFGVLVSRYEGQVYNAVVHLVGESDAEDIAQEVFMKAFRGLGSFRREAKFSTWLYGIMMNCVRTHWRSRRRHRGVFSLDGGNPHEDAPLDPPSPRDGPFADSVRRETVEMVRCAIGGLDGELREIIVLRDIEGLSYYEVSRVLGLPLGTVKSRLFRARSALKDKMAPLWRDGG
jgi:RNA polymerase sigma-70 factor (ECF subfamily)